MISPIIFIVLGIFFIIMILCVMLFAESYWIGKGALFVLISLIIYIFYWLVTNQQQLMHLQ